MFLCRFVTGNWNWSFVPIFITCNCGTGWRQTLEGPIGYNRIHTSIGKLVRCWVFFMINLVLCACNGYRTSMLPHIHTLVTSTHVEAYRVMGHICRFTLSEKQLLTTWSALQRNWSRMGNATHCSTGTKSFTGNAYIIVRFRIFWTIKII